MRKSHLTNVKRPSLFHNITGFFLHWTRSREFHPPATLATSLHDIHHNVILMSPLWPFESSYSYRTHCQNCVCISFYFPFCVTNSEHRNILLSHKLTKMKEPIVMCTSVYCVRVTSIKTCQYNYDNI
jgi:hypothetical protein